jgi:hypothetical protein
VQSIRRWVQIVDQAIWFIILPKYKTLRAGLLRLAGQRWYQRRALRTGERKLTLDRLFRRGAGVDDHEQKSSIFLGVPAPFGATIRRTRFLGVALRCRNRLSKPISLLVVAQRFWVLRSKWCQQWCQ